MYETRGGARHFQGVLFLEVGTHSVGGLKHPWHRKSGHIVWWGLKHLWHRKHSFRGMIVVGTVKTPHLGTVSQVWSLRDEFQVSSLSAQRELGIQDGGAGCSLISL